MMGNAHWYVMMSSPPRSSFSLWNDKKTKADQGESGRALGTVSFSTVPGYLCCRAMHVNEVDHHYQTQDSEYQVIGIESVGP